MLITNICFLLYYAFFRRFISSSMSDNFTSYISQFNSQEISLVLIKKLFSFFKNSLKCLFAKN